MPTPTLDYIGYNSPLYGDSFRELRRRLGWDDSLDQPTPRLSILSSRNFVPEETSPLGVDYLNSNEGSQALYQLYSDWISGLSRNPSTQGYASNANALGQFIGRNTGGIENRYKSAAAVDPTITRQQFLRAYDPRQQYKQANWLQRGERPWAFMGGFKTSGG